MGQTFRIHTNNFPPVVVSAMKWEYRQFEVKTADFSAWKSHIPESALLDLNRLASEGWELVSAVPLARVGGRTDFVSFILRREMA
jgi:hypothetical protein